jgi:hypothetical protein
MRTRLAAILFALCILTVAASSAKADGTTISGSGTWGVNAPVSDWSAPGQTWSFSLTLPNPTPVTSLNGSTELFTTDITAFSYTLNGVAVNIPAASVFFFPTDQFGGLEIDFTAGGSDTTEGFSCSVATFCSFDVFGDQLYTGDAPSITLQPGSASSVDFDYSASGDDMNTNGSGSVDSFSVTPVSTPEPATLSLLAFGAMGLFAKRRKK